MVGDDCDIFLGDEGGAAPYQIFSGCRRGGGIPRGQRPKSVSASRRLISRSRIWKGRSSAALFHPLGAWRGAYRGRQGVLGRCEGDAVDRREGEHGGATSSARRDRRIAACRLYRDGDRSNVVVPSAIRTFRRAYPEIYLTLEEANTRRLLYPGLREGTLRRRRSCGPQARLVSKSFRSYAGSRMRSMVVALPGSRPAAALEEIDLAMLKDDPFLLFPRETAPIVYDTVVDAFSKRAGFEPVIGQLAPPAFIDP